MGREGHIAEVQCVAVVFQAGDLCWIATTQ